MELDQIKELIASLENSKLKKIALRKGDFEIQLEKEGEAVATIAMPASYHAAHLPPHLSPRAPVASSDSHAIAAQPIEPKAALGKFVSSPMVGTYYASPSPDQPVFVKIGDRVEENTVVCIVEAMKVMNEVKAGVSGTVAEILVENAHPVEFGTRIIRVV